MAPEVSPCAIGELTRAFRSVSSRLFASGWRSTESNGAALQRLFCAGKKAPSPLDSAIGAE
jgi:hypothetical protein